MYTPTPLSSMFFTSSNHNRFSFLLMALHIKPLMGKQREEGHADGMKSNRMALHGSYDMYPKSYKYSEKIFYRGLVLG